MRRIWILGGVLGLAIGFGGTGMSAENWPQFRGPNQDGTSSVRSVPQRWSEQENVRWRSELAGKGWSSPVVWKGKVWVSAAREEKARAPEEEKELFAGINPKHVKVRQVAKRIVLQVMALDLESGEVLDEIEVFRIDRPDAIHTLNSYASPTPVIEDGRLFVDFGTFGTAAIDTARGSVLWRRQLPLVHSVGPGSSPLLVDDLLILVRDGVDAQYVTALDAATGKTVWITDRPPMDAPDGEQKKAYCTPLLIDHEGRRQLVIPTSQWVVSYVPDTGEEIWRVRHGDGFSLVPRPVYGCGLVFVCTGFGKPELWAIRPDGEGDVTETHVAWKETKRISKKPSPLLVDRQLYVLSDDGGILSCLDAETGEVLWAERLGGNYSASPVAAGGAILFCSQEGDCHLIRVGGDFERLASNRIDGRIMASPVPLNGGWIVRTEEALYRIGS